MWVGGSRIQSTAPAGPLGNVWWGELGFLTHESNALALAPGFNDGDSPRPIQTLFLEKQKRTGQVFEYSVYSVPRKHR